MLLWQAVQIVGKLWEGRHSPRSPARGPLSSTCDGVPRCSDQGNREAKMVKPSPPSPGLPLPPVCLCPGHLRVLQGREPANSTSSVQH
eukprot:2742087-Pyramimonas_sp.AAC.1